MPTAAGPNTFGEENLVFGYDLGDTANSYRGEPTENLLNDTTEFDSWIKARNSGTTPTVTSNTSPNPLGIPNAPMADTLVIPDDGTYPRIQQYFTPSSTNQHTMSVWIRSLSGDCDCFLGIFRDSPWSLPGHTVVSVTSEWQRFSFTMTPPDTTTHVAYIGSHDAAAQKGNTLELWRAQIEDKSHATSFTAGTRSTTQGLIDLTGNSTIDLTNVSFDSDAQMEFDGTDDTVALGDSSQFNITNSMSVSAWINLDSNSGWKGIFGGAVSGFVHFQLYNGGINVYVYGPNTSYGNPDSVTIGTNVWTNVGFTFGNNTLKVYLNGEQLPTTVTGNGANISSNSDVRFGWAYATSRLFQGKINALTVHNRALTSSEIKANYNAIKGRFNIE